MSAAARAEARRKAILARGGDRLAKLTTSARGEDAPAYMSEDSTRSTSSSARTFVGEEINLPKPQRISPSPSPSVASPTPQPPRVASSRSTSDSFASIGFNPAMTPDPSVWSEDQQAQLLRALMGGGLPHQQQQQGPGGLPGQRASTAPPMSPMEDMLSNMIQQAQSQQAGDAGPPPPDFAQLSKPPPPPTTLQKLMPFVHIVAMWGLLAFFVLRFGSSAPGGAVGFFDRWVDLGRKRDPARGVGIGTGFSIEPVPFFWAFITLEIMLHSLRIFSGYNAVQPHALIALALPHLPPPFPQIIINGLKYLQMASLVLDDIAALIFGIGILILYSTWFAA
ncbi:hypothetical protein BDN72DRAFT_837308 [Pluteus cervinus]|uniref:Uncharacterized protein n=1 Tax=Pluteus cervinus TaxID=181527 RepID=A0ACD3B2A7_9AGAR|nr:hypothetical protein BDN72DRAFT_837308 [Pluteus cervinus]